VKPRSQASRSTASQDDIWLEGVREPPNGGKDTTDARFLAVFKAEDDRLIEIFRLSQFDS
jgi:hypothetical protein